MLFLALLFVSHIYAKNPWECKTFTKVDLKEKYFVPFNSTSPEPYAVNQKCTWEIDIPPGKFAILNAVYKFTIPDTFVILSRTGIEYRYSSSYGDIPQEGKSSFYLPSDADGTRIEFTSTDSFSGYLTFTIELDTQPDLPSQQVGVATSPTVFSMTNLTENRFIFTSPTPYILNMAVSDSNDLFSSCKLYEGNDPQNGTYLMDLNSLTKGEIVIFNSTTTLFCLQGNLPTAYLFALTTPNNLTLEDFWFMRIGTEITMSLSPSSYLTTYCPEGCVEYLQYVDGSDNSDGTFEIHAGMPGNLHQLTQFPLFSANSSLPQEVHGSLRSYYLSNGTANLLIDRNSSTWTTIISERSGFFMSSNYPYLQLGQSALTRLNSTDLMQFTFTIEEIYIGGGNFSVEINYKDYKNYEMFLQSDMPEPYTINPQKGYSIMFDLKQGAEASIGGLVRFQIVDSSSGYGISILLLSCLFSSDW